MHRSMLKSNLAFQWNVECNNTVITRKVEFKSVSAMLTCLKAERKSGMRDISPPGRNAPWIKLLGTKRPRF